MKRFSMFKYMTFACLLVVGLQGRAADAPAKSGDDSFATLLKNSAQTSAERIKERDMEECRSTVKEYTKSKEQFMSYCKSDETKVSDCATRLSECSEISQDEMSFTDVASLTGAPGVPGLFPAQEGKCSKYTTDKLDSLVKEAKSTLSSKEKDALEAARKQASDEEKYAEDNQKKQEEFRKQQKEKAADEDKAKEDARNQKKACDDKKVEAGAKVRTINDEIFSIQKAQQLLIKRRSVDIANYKGMMIAARLKCTTDVKKAIASIDPNAQRAGNLGNAQLKAKEARDLYTSCMDQETTRRITDAEQYKVDMEKFDRQAANKAAELGDAQKSLETLTQMCSQAEADAETKKAKDEDAFQKEQIAKFNEIAAADANMVKKRQINATALSKAEANTKEASNDLMNLKGQEAIGDKGPKEVRRDYLGPYSSAKANFENLGCEKLGFKPLEKSDGKSSKKPITGSGAE